jgi:hypothetical protein
MEVEEPEDEEEDDVKRRPGPSSRRPKKAKKVVKTRKISSKEFVDTSSSEPDGPSPTVPHVSIEAAATDDNMEDEISAPDLGTDDGSMGMNTLDVGDITPLDTSNDDDDDMTGIATSIPQSSMEVPLMQPGPSTRRRTAYGEYLL